MSDKSYEDYMPLAEVVLARGADRWGYYRQFLYWGETGRLGVVDNRLKLTSVIIPSNDEGKEVIGFEVEVKQGKRWKFIGGTPTFRPDQMQEALARGLYIADLYHKSRIHTGELS